MKRIFIILLFAVPIIVFGYYSFFYLINENRIQGHKVVLCIPVYGQSLALGEEAVRITDFDSLKLKYDGRIVNEDLNYHFGCYYDTRWKRFIKRFFRDYRRSFELSIYRMAEDLVTKIGKDTIICTFPGGMGESNISYFAKGNWLYPILISDIKNAYDIANKKGWEFYVPAICWMQGESDIIDYTDVDYQKALKQIQTDLNHEVKVITHQTTDVHLICYQSNAVSIAKKFNPISYDCVEMKPSQAIVDFINDDSLFDASGPTYPYNFMREYLHIDAIGQQHIGHLEAIAVMNIIRGRGKTYGLIPQTISAEGNDVLIKFHVSCLPLVIDTVNVKYVDNYGFSVIDKKGENILSHLSIEGDTVRLSCIKSPIDCKVRYAVNGEKTKSGPQHGPRGNLRDSQGEREFFSVQGITFPVYNWAYQFDMLCE